MLGISSGTSSIRIGIPTRFSLNKRPQLENFGNFSLEGKRWTPVDSNPLP